MGSEVFFLPFEKIIERLASGESLVFKNFENIPRILLFSRVLPSKSCLLGNILVLLEEYA